MIDRALICRLLAVAMSSALGCCTPAWADPDEAWITRAPLPSGTRPLLVFVLDTSAAMTERVSVIERYDPQFNYGTVAGAGTRCNPLRIYWRRGPGPAPDCGTMAGLASAPTTGGGMHCDGARGALETLGVFVAARAAQWRPTTGGGHWDALRRGAPDAVECRSDRGQHGSEPGRWFAADGSRGPWSAMPDAEIAWDAAPHGDSYIFYTGNFLNYLAATSRTIETSLAQAVTAVLTDAVAATDELDVALVRLSDDMPDAEGGFVALAPQAVATALARLPTLLAGWPASGAAPLAESLIETAGWLSGDHVRYGNDVRADVAARDPRDSARYLSPYSSPCRPISVVLATAGRPTEDDGARIVASGLPGFEQLTGGCDSSCLAALALWMTKSDLREDLPGRQSVSVLALTAPVVPDLVADALAAVAGRAASVAGPLAFAEIVARSLQHDAAVAAGEQLSAAGFLHQDDLTHAPAVFHGLSAPRRSQRWPGNLLRYGLSAPENATEPAVAVGRDGEPAIDPMTGLPRTDSHSVWSEVPDGGALLAGGAASRLPAADARRLYSDLTADALTSTRNRLVPGNSSLSRALIGLDPHDPQTADGVLAWLRNQRTLGDPGRAAPVVVSDSEGPGRSVFLATHDGLVHAFDADTGIERWAFLPKPLLPRLPELMRDEATAVRGHGIDGPLVIHRHDPDGNGRIDASAGEHLWLFFGLGRGGSGYYALDVASPDEPRLLWSLGPDELGSGTESWPEPVVARLSIDGTGQGPGNWIVVLAGGHDRAYDFAGPGSGAIGAVLSIVDAATGRLLWRAAGSDALNPDLHLSEMTASLASAPRAIDMDGDGRVDRLYLIDIEGGLWRIDLENGVAPTDLARGRLLARLGSDGQRFQSTPDLAMVRQASGLQLAITVGSGWLSRPRDTTVTDRLYSIRDQETGASARALHDTDLHDASDGQEPMPAGAPGWFVRLASHGLGEKVIGSSLTFDHRLHFLTYQPLPAPVPVACGPPQAVRRLRTLDVRTGLPASLSVPSGDTGDRELQGSGLPSPLRFFFPGPWDGSCADCRARPFGVAGPEIFDSEFSNDPVKTSWRKLPTAPASR